MNSNPKDIILAILPLLLYIVLNQFQLDFTAYKLSEERSQLARNRRKKCRITWSSVSHRISDKQFRRMFRMSRHCFNQLCQHIILSIGEDKFKSESYIDAFLKNKNLMYLAHEKSSGGYVSGKVKLAITLRILAGGDPLDLGVLFDIHPTYCNQIMIYVLKEWVNCTKLGGINIYDYLSDNDQMSKVSEGFSKRSDGVFKGAIGSLDGWLVPIIRPSLWRDGI